MGAEDALFTIAEMAIGVAGFSAIVAAFAGRGPLSLTDRRRFVWLFTCSFVAALLAYVPVLLREASLSGPDLWRYSSASMSLVWVVASVVWVFGEVRQRGAGASQARGVWQGPAHLVPSFLNFLLQLCNVFGLFWEPSAAAYIGGTLVWLYAAALVFVSIVLERPAV